MWAFWTGIAGLFCMSHVILEHTQGSARTLKACEPRLCNKIWFHAHRTFVGGFFLHFSHFFYLTDSSSLSSCPDQFPLWRPFCLIIHTRIRDQSPQYPLCGNHGAMRAVQIKLITIDQTELPNKVRSSSSSRQLSCYDKMGLCCPLLVKKTLTHQNPTKAVVLSNFWAKVVRALRKRRRK